MNDHGGFDSIPVVSLIILWCYSPMFYFPTRFSFSRTAGFSIILNLGDLFGRLEEKCELVDF
jgi:hypothetical protein